MSASRGVHDQHAGPLGSYVKRQVAAARLLPPIEPQTLRELAEEIARLHAHVSLTEVVCFGFGLAGFGGREIERTG